MTPHRGPEPEPPLSAQSTPGSHDPSHPPGSAPDGLAPLQAQTQAPDEEVTLWDPALRLFHWALVLSVCAAWGLGHFGPDVMTLHFWCGYVICALLVFRVVWGFIGPKPARFSSFLRGPGAILDYIRHLPERRPSNWLGHNPLGGLSVLVMILLLGAQVVTGLVSDPQDFINVGPLADSVSPDTAERAPGWHELISNLILAVVLFHVGAILFYRHWKGEDLVTPMITGRKRLGRKR